MFDLDFLNNLQQALRDNSGPVKPTSHNYRTYLLCEHNIYWGRVDQYSLVETLNKKWPKNESDP